MGLLSLLPIVATLLGLFGSVTVLVGDGLGHWTLSTPGLLYMGMVALFLVFGLRGVRGSYRR